MTFHETPDDAFILAAGRGARLRPLTDETPKPLVPVGGVPIIDRVLDALDRRDVRSVTVNLHHKADMLEAHLRRRCPEERLNLSREDALLDTGGGLKKGLPFMGGRPFFALSGDSFWIDGGTPALDRMAQAWDPERMDLLLLLQPVSSMTLTPGIGDYDILPDGRLERSPGKTGDYMWTSVRIVAPSLFDDTPDGPFSFLTLMDKAQERGRLYGLVHDGEWIHITTSEDLRRVNDAFGDQMRFA